MTDYAFIALGSNIEPRDGYLLKALRLIEREDAIEIEQISSIYETEPVGYLDQASFLNMVIKINTSMKPIPLLAFLQSIEKHLDRVREIPNGPRTIDLDILLYNEENIVLEQLCIPHPRMQERAFVLVPMQEIAPLDEIPTLNKSIEQSYAALPERLRKGVLLWKQQGQEEEFGLFGS